MNDLSITIASVPDRENVVAELWYKNQLWGELSYENNEFQLEIYPSSRGDAWNFNYEKVLQSIIDAKEKLINELTIPQDILLQQLRRVKP